MFFFLGRKVESGKKQGGSVIYIYEHGYLDISVYVYIYIQYIDVF